MTDFFCSICGRQKPLTIFAATLLCKDCLDTVKSKAQEQQEPVSKVIVEQSMSDIYD